MANFREEINERKEDMEVDFFREEAPGADLGPGKITLADTAGYVHPDLLVLAEQIYDVSYDLDEQERVGAERRLEDRNIVDGDEVEAEMDEDIRKLIERYLLSGSKEYIVDEDSPYLMGEEFELDPEAHLEDDVRGFRLENYGTDEGENIQEYLEKTGLDEVVEEGRAEGVDAFGSGEEPVLRVLKDGLPENYVGGDRIKAYLKGQFPIDSP